MVVLALVGAAAAYPRPDGPPAYGPPPPKYAPAPAPKYKPAPKPGYKPEEYPPQPYQFEYGVSDQYTGTNFQAVENQNDAGSVVGKKFNISYMFSNLKILKRLESSDFLHTLVILFSKIGKSEIIKVAIMRINYLARKVVLDHCINVPKTLFFSVL